MVWTLFTEHDVCSNALSCVCLLCLAVFCLQTLWDSRSCRRSAVLRSWSNCSMSSSLALTSWLQWVSHLLLTKICLMAFTCFNYVQCTYTHTHTYSVYIQCINLYKNPHPRCLLNNHLFNPRNQIQSTMSDQENEVWAESLLWVQAFFWQP